MTAVVIAVSGPTYARLTQIQGVMRAAKQRQVTYSEVVDELIKVWDQTAALLDDLKGAGR